MKKLKGKNIAIVALGGSFSEYVLSRINSVKYDEVWGINSIGAIFHVDKTFMMDPASRFLDDVKAGLQTGVGREFLLKTPNKGPIYSCALDERVPEIIEYPLAEVVKKVEACYFNNTVAYAVAFAIAAEVGKINLFGIDFSYKKNIHHAEAGRACVEFWCAIATKNGIPVQVARSSSLLDTNVPDNEKLYGYHRLENPLVQTFSEGNLMIAKQSEMTAPEPIDTQEKDAVLIGRHDIPNVSYIEENKPKRGRPRKVTK